MEVHLPRMRLSGPTSVNPASVSSPGNPCQYAEIEQLTFSRPLYLQLMAPLLVLLTAGAAAYAVFAQPLSQLIVNAGALLLGIWGMRSILVGDVPAFGTAVDLALASVVLFLLTAIIVRALYVLEERSGLHVPLIGRSRSDQ